MKLGKMKLVLLIALALVSAGCSCRTRKVTPEGDNIDYASEGKELKDVNYAFDSYALDATAKAILAKNADWLKANADRKVQVEGHCDERGTNEYNMALGAKRSESSANYLKSLGIEASRVSTISYGEELPLDPAHNEAAWAKNRRAHFKVTK